MTQKLIAGALGGTGIVAVLFIIGMVLSASGIESGWGSFAIGAAIFIGVVMGLLGIFGILRRLAG